jgi:hypothetical protein
MSDNHRSSLANLDHSWYQRSRHSTFDIQWEGTTNIDTNIFEEYYDDIPVIMDGIDKDDEIKVRSFVYEARMVSYGCDMRNALSFGPGRTGNMFDSSFERFGLRQTNHVVRKDAAREVINTTNKRTINRRPTSLIMLPVELFNKIKSEAIPRIERAKTVEDAIRENLNSPIIVDKKERMEHVPPLLKWAYKLVPERCSNCCNNNHCVTTCHSNTTSNGTN